MEQNYKVYFEVDGGSRHYVYEGTSEDEASEAFALHGSDLGLYLAKCKELAGTTEGGLIVLVPVYFANGDGEILDEYAPALIIDGTDEFTFAEVDEARYRNRSCCIAESGSLEYICYMDSEDAGLDARDHWEDMARNDKREFVALIGEDRLMDWATDGSDGYGCSSLNDFLDLVESCPEEFHGSYDGREYGVTGISAELEDALGYVPTVAYRRS